ncbi:hypothetical protein GW916_06310 [bacterium]|nr:hypothetical protein [bacterium]
MVIPLKVIDELDQRKSDSNERKQKSARTAIKKIEYYIYENKGKVQNDTSIQYGPEITSSWLLENEFDPSIIDHHIIATAEQLSSDTMTIIVSDDAGMRARAQSKGIAIFRIPEELKKEETNALVKENLKLKNELHQIQIRVPKLKILVNGQDNYATFHRRKPISCLNLK